MTSCLPEGTSSNALPAGTPSLMLINTVAWNGCLAGLSTSRTSTGWAEVLTTCTSRGFMLRESVGQELDGNVPAERRVRGAIAPRMPPAPIFSVTR